MGLLKDSFYLNFKSYKRSRIQQQVFTKDENGVEHYSHTEDRLIFDIDVNVYDNINKENLIVIPCSVYTQYKESISDEDIYNLLKTKIISYSDAFDRKIEIDLTKGVTDVLENTL